jgi:hypothetical protein
MADGQYFGGFLWAPSEEYWHNIMRHISSNFQITYIKKYKFETSHDLEKMIIKLYKYDHVPMERIKNVKIANLMKFAPKCLHFQFWVPNPENVGRGNHIIEPNVINMKNSIRRKYRKYITNYKRDIIIHISDNVIQTGFIDDIINRTIHKVSQHNHKD